MKIYQIDNQEQDSEYVCMYKVLPQDRLLNKARVSAKNIIQKHTNGQLRTRLSFDKVVLEKR